MDAKQIARIAPPLILVVLVGLAIKSLFSSDETAKKPDNETTAPERKPEPLNSSLNLAGNKGNPQSPAGIAAVTPALCVPIAVAPIIPEKIQPEIPLPAQNKPITREEMAGIFNGRGLTRKSAVAELENRGHSRTASYNALLENERFSAWLHFAPDGIITWKD